MKIDHSKLFSVVFVLFFAVIFFSTVDAAEVITQDVIEKDIIAEVDLIRMVDNFIIYFDASSSTNELLPGTEMTRLEAAKKLLEYRNEWLPDLGYEAGLFVYTPFKTISDMAQYNRTLFGAAIDALPDRGKGPTLIQKALSKLRDIVAMLAGRTAVIIFTDGRFSIHESTKSPLGIAKEIARENDVCFYMVSSATGKTQERLKKAVTGISPCSRVVDFQAFIDRPNYLSGALFTMKVSAYEKIRRVRRVVGFSMEDIYFDFNKAALRPVFRRDLEKLGKFMRANPKAYAVVSGYSCSIGPDKAKMQVSRARAETVADYLIDKLNIAPDRVISLWYGQYNPSADNGSAKGRRLNRRVEIAVGGLE